MSGGALGQFGPDAMPVGRAQLAPRDGAAGHALDVGAPLDGHLTSVDPRPQDRLADADSLGSRGESVVGLGIRAQKGQFA
mgnify:CR=1 FL=1